MAARLLFLSLVFAVFCCAATEAASANPFLSPKKKTEARTGEQTEASKAPSVLQPALRALAKWQFSLRTKMAGFARNIKTEPYGRPFWMFMLLGFAYGVLHALGPGHGKVFAVSYFMNRPGTMVLGIAFGNLAMFFHVLSSAVLVLSGKYLFETSMSSTVEDMGGRLELVSYAMLALIGTGLFMKILLDWRRGGHHPCRHAGGAKGGWKELAGTTLAAGLVPCPGAALILVFSISLGIQSAGLWALLCISLGMGLTISFFAVAAIVSRNRLLAVVERHEKLYHGLHLALSLAGSLGIALMGGILLAGRLQT